MEQLSNLLPISGKTVNMHEYIESPDLRLLYEPANSVKFIGTVLFLIPILKAEAKPLIISPLVYYMGLKAYVLHGAKAYCMELKAYSMGLKTYRYTL